MGIRMQILQKKKRIKTPVECVVGEHDWEWKGPLFDKLGFPLFEKYVCTLCGATKQRESV